VFSESEKAKWLSHLRVSAMETAIQKSLEINGGPICVLQNRMIFKVTI